MGVETINLMIFTMILFFFSDQNQEIYSILRHDIFDKISHLSIKIKTKQQYKIREHQVYILENFT